MRLEYLWIENYKNLKNMLIDFYKGDGLTMLMGTNGSGKSNILEAISMIFSQVYQNTKKNALNCNYILCYSINESVIYITGQKMKSTVAKIYNKGEEKVKPALIDLEGREAALNFIKLISSKSEEIDAEGIPFVIDKKINDEDLPNNVIAVYSGEETRLWENIFKKPYQQYIKNIRNGVNISLRMTYLDKTYWNIALFVLWFSLSVNNEIYLKEEIGISHIDKVEFEINRDLIKNYNNPLLLDFIKRLFPGDDKTVTLVEQEIRERLCDRTVAAIVGEITHGKDKTSIPIQIRNSLYTEIKQVFQFLIQACLSTSGKPLISKIDITFNNSLNTYSLSEGEKKLLLIKCALDIGGNENSLVLLDEPDAHVHEYRKKYILDMINDYKNYGRQFVLTTHSPTLANLYNCEGRIMLEMDDNACAKVIPYENVKAVEYLTGGIWSAVEQNIFFSSVKPLILVEGIGDIRYIEKAIEVLASTNEQYRKLSCDFLQMGGAGENSKQFIDRLSPYVNPNRTVIVLFDRDEEGSKGMEVCVGKGNDRQRDNGVYRKGNWYYLMLPKASGHSCIDFLIEDYFSKDMKNTIAQGFLDNADGHFKMIPKDLKGSVKNDLVKRISEYDSVVMIGFTALLDKLIAIINGTESDVIFV